MDEYGFRRDFFDTYQSLSDGLKVLWLVAPLAFGLGLAALILRYRLAGKQLASGPQGDLAYTLRREDDGALRVYRHGAHQMPDSAVFMLEGGREEPDDAGQKTDKAKL